MGNGFRGVDGAKIRRYDARQAQATRPRPSEPPQGVQKGEVNVNTPNVAELLVQQTEKATRLAVEVEQLRQRLQEIARLSAECSDPDELRRELDRLTRQQ